MSSRLHQMTRQAVTSLLAETGHQLRLDDFEDIHRLNALAERIADPLDADNTAFLDSPTWVRDIPFYPLTLAKATFIEDQLREWAGNDLDKLYIGIAFVLSWPNSRKPVDQFSAAGRFNRAARYWSARNRMTVPEILAVVASMLPGDDGTAGSKKAVSYGALIASLCAEFGQSPDYWLFECGMDKLRKCVVEHNEKIESAMRKSGHGKNEAPAFTPKMAAIQAFKMAETELRGKWQQVA